MDNSQAVKKKKARSVYRKKHVFKGNRYTKKVVEQREEQDMLPNVGPSHQDETPATPVTARSEKKSVSAKKIASHNHGNDAKMKEYRQTPTGFRFMDLEVLSTVISLLACPECCHIALMLLEIPSKRKGCASFLHLECKQCSWKNVFHTSGKTKRTFTVNRQLTYAMRSVGLGRNGAEKICCVMNMPPPQLYKYYKAHAHAVKNAAKGVAEDTMLEAAAEIRAKKGGAEFVEVGVSGDGSWQKRGYSSLHGTVNVMSMETGKVLDTEVLTQFCRECSLHEQDNKKELAYEVWKTEHMPKCKANFSGSSGAMEPKGIENIFGRSAQSRNLLYTEFYCDGDSKSFDRIKHVYLQNHGKDVKRLQCVGHVQKRVGTSLQKLKKNVKGLGGRGKLTKALIDKLQNYYGIAIRSNVGDLAGMKKSIDASLFHCIATKEQAHFHVHCPDGKDSWCKFKRDQAENTNTYKPTAGIPKEVLKEIRPIYARLSEKSLLEQCLHGKTQNQNESLNAMIWQRAPKELFVGSECIETANYDAIAHFNIGATASVKILEKLDIPPGQHTIQACSKIDERRINNAEYKEKESVKKARKQKRGRKKRKIDRQEAEEGPQYGPGQFSM